MNKKLLVSIIASIVFVALLVGGWFIFSAANTPVQPDVKNSSPATLDSDPTNTAPATSEPTATPLTDEEAVKDYKDKSDNFADAKAVDFFTEEETRAALQVSQDFAESSLTNKYFLSGQWIKDGLPMKQLDNAIGQYLSKDLRAEIGAWDDNGKKVEAKDALPLIFYVGDTGEISPSKYCAFNFNGTDDELSTPAEGGISCPLTGVTVSEMKYEPTKSGEIPGILVEFTASTEVPLTINEGGKDAKTKVTYTYSLNLISNTYQEDTINPQKFVIDDYDIKVLASKVEPYVVQ